MTNRGLGDRRVEGEMQAPDYDVLIAGYGPVGATAANFAGRYGLRTLVLERDEAVYRLPRAGTCDDEAMRIWQAAGLADRLLPHFLPQELIEFLDDRGRPFFELRGDGFGYGFHAFMLLYQPFLEKVLREGVERYPSVEVRLRHELVDVEERNGLVVARVRDHGAEREIEVTGRYLVGCDGGRSTVRKVLGAELLGTTFQQWLVVDVAVDDAEKYPGNLQFVCDPERPSVNYPMAFGHHRFQFMLLPGETQEAMEAPDVARRLLAPWASLDEVELVRSAVYVYHARLADRWSAGRVFLAGDSAHLTPPFGGTGMNSGIRDALNLLWKLRLVLGGRADPRILDTYQAERHPHVAEMTRMAVRFSRVLQTTAGWRAALRNLGGRILGLTPVVGPWLRSGRFKPVPAYGQGFMVGGRRRGGRVPEGRLFPQPRVGTSAGEIRLDEILGGGFAVLAIGADPRALVGDDELWVGLDTRWIRVDPGGGRPAAGSEADGDPTTVIDGTGELGRWFRQHGVAVAVLRPDRFVFAAYRVDDANGAAAELRQALFPE